jgi:hypothetical protein
MYSNYGGRNPWNGTIFLVIAAVGAFLFIALALEGQSPSKSATPTTLAPAPTVVTLPPTPPTTVYSFFEYESSPQHVARINAALTSYGEAVLPAIMDFHWGPRDAYCNLPDQNIPTNYISKGYIPKPGDICNVAHSPDYGGSKDLIEADVLVGSNGKFTNHFVGEALETPTCTVTIDSYDIDSKLLISVTVGHSINAPSTDTVHTLAEAEAVDTQAIICLNETRP